MASFHFNRFSGETAASQWSRYLQVEAYISDVGDIVSRNMDEIRSTMHDASAEQRQAFHQLCGALDNGFNEVTRHLRDVTHGIADLRSEINGMAAMLDWRLSLMIEEQRIATALLGELAQLLRIPDSQKQRVYYIEQGLKYLKSAIREGIDSAFFTDALEEFKKAEQIERKDYFTLNRIGHIYLYSRLYMDIPLSEQYFRDSARYAYAEAIADGTATTSRLTPKGDLPQSYSKNPFDAATAEAYLYAGRACYLQRKLPQAVANARNAYQLMPEFLEAGFEQAKYLAASDRDDEAATVLLTVMVQDRSFVVKMWLDSDLGSKERILKLVGEVRAKAISLVKRELSRSRDNIIALGGGVGALFDELERQLSTTSAMTVLDVLKVLDVLTVGGANDFDKALAALQELHMITVRNKE